MMIDESRIRHMAQEYQMNPSTARKLLEHARDVPALRYGEQYRETIAGEGRSEAVGDGRTSGDSERE